MNTYRLSLLVVSMVVFSLFPSGVSAAEGRMSWLSIAPEVGYVFFKKGELEKDYRSKVPARHGVVVKGHVDIGGDGLAMELAPLFTWQSGDAFVGDLTGVGGEAGFVFRFSSGNFFPGIGAGFRGVYYVSNSVIERGTDLTARFPVGATWYFARYLGLVMEGGIILGATGIRFKDGDDPVRSNLSERTEFAFVFGFDLLLGLRFP